MLPWWKLKTKEDACRYSNIYTGHSCSLAMPYLGLVFYYSLLLNVCEPTAMEIFLLEPKVWGGGAAWVGFFYCFNTLRAYMYTLRVLKQYILIFIDRELESTRKYCFSVAVSQLFNQNLTITIFRAIHWPMLVRCSCIGNNRNIIFIYTNLLVFLPFVMQAKCPPVDCGCWGANFNDSKDFDLLRRLFL